MRNVRWMQAAAAATVALVSVSDACVQAPLFSPGVCLDTGSIEFLDETYTVDVYVKGYTLFGGSPGQFCSCAFNLPRGADLCEIIGARVTFPGTDLPVPGFGAFENSTAGDQAWNLTQSGNWFSFVAPVEVPIGVGDEVDLCFTLEGKLNSTGIGPTLPTPGGGAVRNLTLAPMQSVVDQIVADVQQALVGATVGTDEASSTGLPLNAHQAITGLGRVMDETLAYESLGGGVPGTSGELFLVGSGVSSAIAGGGELSLLGALPSASALLFLGFDNLSTPYFGGTFVPSVESVVGLQTDALGEVSVALPAVPAAVSGSDLYAQVWMNDVGAIQGLAGSNALRTLLE